MSALHLNHLLSWKDLVDHCSVYKDTGIELPVGDCGRIHVVDKGTKMKVANRRYLADKVCGAEGCAITGSAVFRKTETKKLAIPMQHYNLLPWNYDTFPSFSRFIDSFSRAIEDFSKTERQKVRNRNLLPKRDPKEIIKKLKEEGTITPEMDWHGCYCCLFVVLIEMGDLNTLLSLSDEHIRAVLGCQHGGQAVGNNLRFLTWYVLQVYLITNLIAALDLQEKPNEWGQMTPGRYFRNELMADCDGQTFLFFSRKFLKEDVYMKDWEAMRELCKNCFRFLYTLDMVRKEVEGSECRDTKSYFFS